MPQPAVSVGTVILRRRKTKKLSQKELGARLGTTRQVVLSWEKGKNHPSPRHQAGLVRELGGRLSDYGAVTRPASTGRLEARLKACENQVAELEAVVAEIKRLLSGGGLLPG